ncbi:MAG: hypothetical protein QME60_04025 [Verrucomicrobiota bacterium]|nr:hypothetical protein [Verrucomicrobiota bacterium]
MRARQLSNSVGASLDPCAAIQAYLEIPPGQSRHVVFALGAARGEAEAHSLIRRYSDPDGARQALEEVWQFWKHLLGGVYVETPDLSLNFLTNHWLLYQTLSARFWGRSGYYQSGGAYGFRDQLQDSLAFLHECPWLTRQHLLLAAGRQFRDGDVQHWWHPPAGCGIRTRISDDLLWLPYAVGRYVKATGDTGVLDEAVPFVDGRALQPEEESCYDLPRVTEHRAPLYEHCVLAIRRALAFGPHGLPLMGTGDWNDGMNRVGRQGRGESVWLAFFLLDVVKRFAELADSRDDTTFAGECRETAEKLSRAVDASAWDGAWYRRAFFDDGAPLGASAAEECRIDSLPQSWAVLSGAPDRARAERGVRSALRLLEDSNLRLLKLFTPPFDAAPVDPGYIKGYVPGVRENGGQYTHAAVWLVAALARLGDAEAAWRLFSFLNPVTHADTPKAVNRYKVEPYVLAADVYTAANHEGRGGWTWYTGSAGWLYQIVVEELLGVRLETDALSFAPLFQPGWSEYTIHYRYRNTFYHIRVVKVKTGDGADRACRVFVDGVESPDGRLHLADDGLERAARVEAG